MLDQLAEWCPLCDCKHPPKFHAFAKRTYREDNIESDDFHSTQVPRIMCLENKRQRFETGEALQYTLTILPGFLIAHSRIVVDAVDRALHSYIAEQAVTQTGAAMKMGCVNPLSFRLFYQRVCGRIDSWISLMMQLVVELGAKVLEDKQSDGNDCMRSRWPWYRLVAAQYIRLYAMIAEKKEMPQAFSNQFLYARLASHRMGLGP